MQVRRFVIRYKKKSTQRASIMSEFTVPASTPHAVKSCHPFLSAVRNITQLPQCGRSNCDIGFFLIFFSTHHRVPLACSWRGFLSVIFPPPGNYVGAADQTREEADAALKKSRFAYLNPVGKINGERQRTKRRE